MILRITFEVKDWRTLRGQNQSQIFVLYCKHRRMTVFEALIDKRCYRCLGLVVPFHLFYPIMKPFDFQKLFITKPKTFFLDLMMKLVT
jgi:hypothetical protein